MIFKKWGIKSILMNNFMTYEYYLIIPSNLYFKTILLVGRANDKYKRFELGLLAFEYIYQNIPESKMIIISSLNETSFLSELEENLNSNNIENPGYVSELEQFYKNASLHIIPSISESFSMVLCETKIYGIPNILLGLEYLSASSGGTIIIYDDTPESLAKEAIKILKDTNYRKFLGEQARINIQKFNNQKLLERWTKLLLSIYNSKNYYQKMIKEDKKISKKSAINIIKNEVNLIRKREKKLLNMTFYDILIDLIDNNAVSLSNLNRYLFAIYSTIGKSKVDVAKTRALDINPKIKVNVHQVFYKSEKKNCFDFSQ